MTFLSHLACSKCKTTYPAGHVYNLCAACGAPLLVYYDLDRARREWRRESIREGPATMWRYGPLLPVSRPESIVSLGEGMTPLVRAHRLGERLGAERLYVKDEGLNPTASFKARGLSCAVSMARELGIRELAIPSAGNAASALAAYAAAAGLPAHIYMPRDVPAANFIECKMFGADVTLVDGLISDCGRIVAEKAKSQGWFDVSTLKEPYRIEGKKTMGLELAEQMSWKLPDAIFYPTGGGVGIIGMWKAFGEMEQLGWIGPARPKMIVVQAAGCRPVVEAFEQGKDHSEFWQNAATVASGLRVPKALGDFLILEAVRQSNGTAVAVSDQELLDAGQLLAQTEGLFVAPEGAACVAALEKLLRSGFLQSAESIVIYNTGSGLKYLESYGTRFGVEEAAEERLGGLVLPR
ncbi:MAG TPA: threonine synthase, partial [Bryobacterales bacterium]|nr:threonine synthase [Bryobacterales bacterium]